MNISPCYLISILAVALFLVFFLRRTYWTFKHIFRSESLTEDEKYKYLNKTLDLKAFLLIASAVILVIICRIYGS